MNNSNCDLIINGKNYDREIYKSQLFLRGLVDAMPGLEFGSSQDDKYEPYPKVKREEGPYLIVSDGLSINTKVYHEGIALKNICEVEIMPIVPDEYVRARITVIMPRLDILANVDFSDHK